MHKMANTNLLIENRAFIWSVFIICFSLPSALLLNFLSFNKYSPLTLEAVCILFAFCIISIVYASISRACRPVGVFLVSLILIFYFSSIIPFVKFIDWVENWLSLPKLIIGGSVKLLAVLSTFLILIRLRVLGWRALSVASLIILSSTIITWWTPVQLPRVKKTVGTREMAHQDLPPILYIIFDEHMSIKWTPNNITSAVRAKQDMIDFYDKFDFLLFTNAFSRYADTDASLSNALNFSAHHFKVALSKKEQGRKLIRNKVFEILKKRGYRIRIYQSQYMDFCDSDDERIEFCLEYGNNYIGDLQGTDISTIHKALLIIGHWFRAIEFKEISVVRSILSTFLGKNLLRVPILGVPYRRVGPINVVPIMERLRTDLNHFPRGTAFFAHFLIPHYPYVYDDQFTLKKDPSTWLGPSGWYGDQIPPPRIEQYRHYYDQVRGLYRWLNKWFDELKEIGLLNDIVVIFHGDHGSKIVHEVPHARTISHPHWNRIVKDGFSTLFALKDPSISKGRIEIAKPIDILLKEYFIEPTQLTIAKPHSFFLFLKTNRGELKKYRYDHW